jgi:hypothetical protein
LVENPQLPQDTRSTEYKILTTGLNMNSAFCPHNVFMYFVYISEDTSTVALYGINLLGSTVEMESVYCAVQTGPLNKTDYVSFLKGSSRKVGRDL